MRWVQAVLTATDRLQPIIRCHIRDPEVEQHIPGGDFVLLPSRPTCRPFERPFELRIRDPAVLFHKGILLAFENTYVRLALQRDQAVR